MNNIIIKGRLTREVELKTTTSGKEVANFSVAVNRRFNKEETDFFNVQAWGKTGVFCSTYFKKGQEVLVQGEMQCRKYQDKDGNNRSSWDLTAENVEFCGSKSDNGGSNYTPVTKPSGIDVIEDNSTPASPDNKNVGDFVEISADDDLPFNQGL